MSCMNMSPPRHEGYLTLTREQKVNLRFLRVWRTTSVTGNCCPHSAWITRCSLGAAAMQAGTVAPCERSCPRVSEGVRGCPRVFEGVRGFAEVLQYFFRRQLISMLLLLLLVLMLEQVRLLISARPFYALLVADCFKCNKLVVTSCVYRSRWCQTVNQCCSFF